MRRAPAALRLEDPEHVPQRTDGTERPRVAAGVERALEPAHDGHRIVRALERRPERRLGCGERLRRDDETRRLVPTGGDLARDGVPQAERQPPAMVRAARLEPELQRTDLGQPDLEMHGQRALLDLLPEADDGPERRQCRERAGRRVDQVAGLLAGAIRRREERERDRPIRHQLELAARQVHRFALLHAARDEAEEALVRQPQVVRPRRAASDPDADPPAREPIRGGAARDCELERVGVEHRRAPCAARIVPAADDRRDALADGRRLERAAVEEDRVGPDERMLGVARGRALARQELGQVPGDAGVRRERQPPLADAGCATIRPRVGRHDREEPVEDDALELAATDGRRERAADDAGAATRHHWLTRRWKRGASSCPPGTRRASAARARAMSMLSPPRSRCSPTAMRSRPTSPRLPRAATSEKSVVPPPTSTTRTTGVAAIRSRQSRSCPTSHA